MADTVQTEDTVVELSGERYRAVHLESLRRDVTPDFDLYIRPGEKDNAVLYSQQGVVFDRQQRFRLSENKIEHLYVREAQQRKYFRHLANQLPNILKDEGLSAERKSSILYDSAQAVLEEVFKGPLSRTSVQQGKEIVRNTVEFMSSPEFALAHLLRKMSADDYLYTHSINVVAYSIALARQTGHNDKATLRELAHGALLHDIGEFNLDQSLWNKPDALTLDERQQIHAHPAEGIRQLEKVGMVGEIAQDIVLHHHEKLDGSGYPNGLKGDEISIWVRMVTIADVFDAMTTERHFQEPRTSVEAIKIMQKEMETELDQELLRDFIQMMVG